MKAIAATLVLFSVTPAVAQQCGKGQMPGPPGSGQCIQVCGPGYSIGKDASGFNTCLRDGNAAVGPHHAKYAFLSLAAGKDDICFGIRADERVETVVDDHFIDVDWHVQPKHAYVAEISYTLDPGTDQAAPHRGSVLARRREREASGGDGSGTGERRSAPL